MSPLLSADPIATPAAALIPVFGVDVAELLPSALRGFDTLSLRGIGDISSDPKSAMSMSRSAGLLWTKIASKFLLERKVGRR